MLLISCSSAQFTALHRAACGRRTEACQLLIAGKADVNATNWCAFTLKNATDFVLRFVFETRLMIFWSSERRTALHDAALVGHTEVCQLLIASKANVDATDM